jgi:2-(1,2-epoxy-1,2-dihydrophenyl)acetyl-CoA isomerase
MAQTLTSIPATDGNESESMDPEAPNALPVPSLRFEATGAVTVVTLDRPERRNTIDFATCVELRSRLAAMDADSAVRAIVIAGTDRDFCTGADVTARPDGAAVTSALDYRYLTIDYQRLFQQLWEMETPVVSAVTGTVAGAGWMLALLADLVVAAEGARWTHVFTRRGMIPHAGDPYFLPRVLPFHRLNEIAMLSDPVTSETLAGWGVVNRCVPADEVRPVALALASRLAAGPTRSLGLTKRLYRRSLDSDMLTAFEEERTAQALISTTHDRREGLQAFVEGRPPDFTGA